MVAKASDGRTRGFVLGFIPPQDPDTLLGSILRYERGSWEMLGKSLLRLLTLVFCRRSPLNRAKNPGGTEISEGGNPH